MENFLPSEVARLVLGYLEEQGCLRAYNEFLEGCRHLEECRGRSFFTRIMGLSLCDILDEFCAIQSYIRDIKCGEEFKRRVVRCSSLLEKVKLFVDNNTPSDGVFTEIKTVKVSRSTQSTRRSQAHKSRYTRSNSCDSIITVKTDNSYSHHGLISNERRVGDPSYDMDRRMRHGRDVARSAESLAEATNLADLPGNKGYLRNNGDQVDFQPAHRERRSLPSSSNVFITPSCAHSHKMSGNTHPSLMQKYKENLNKSIDKSFRNKNSKSLDFDELEFRKALGLVKHSEVPDKSAYKTPSKRMSSKLKQCSTIKKSHADPFPSDSLNVTTITNAFLDCTELHEKLAENINTMYNSSVNSKLLDPTETNINNAKEDPSTFNEVSKEPNEVTTIDDDVPQLDSLIKSIVDKTEKDPIFDQLVNEVLAASVDSSSESDVISRPGTSTPEKSCRSQANESSPTPSWVSEDRQSFTDDKLQKHKSTLPRSAELGQKQSSINLINVSPHKNYNRNRRYPRGGKRMDILRENYRNYLECGNDDDNSYPTPSTKSDTPPLELPKVLPQKSNQKVIILSNEIVQTHIMPNNGPLVIQKAEESTGQQPTVISHSVSADKPMEVVHSHRDKTVTGETQQISSVPDDPVCESISVGCSDSSVNTVRQHPVVGPTLTDPQVIDNAGMIQSTPDLQLVNNSFKSFYKVPFVPGTVHYLNVHNPGKQEMLPPISKAKALPEMPYDTTLVNKNYDQSKTSVSRSLRAFRRNVVTGKPPDIVISNGKVGVQTDTMNQACFSKEEIMKMPTIIMTPNKHLDANSDSEKSNQESGADKEPKNTSGTINELSPNITFEKKCRTKLEKITHTSVVQQPKLNWSINVSSKNTNSETSGIQTLADVASTLHPVISNQTQPLTNYLQCNFSNESKQIVPQSHFSLAIDAPSTCTTFRTTAENHGNVLKPQSFIRLNNFRDDIQSNPSSEDDRFVIDEQKNAGVPAPQTISAVAESKNDDPVSASNDAVSINVATCSQESDVTEGLEIKRNTPDLIIGKRSSVSTPRRSFSHVRVLEFNTPPRTCDEGTRQTQSSPKQSLSHKYRNTVQKSHNLRPKAYNVKSQLFPTIPEKQSKCKVMKPVKRSRGKCKDKTSTEVTVSNVWDDVQGMGQILKDEHSAVAETDSAKEKSSNEDNGSSKNNVDKLPNTHVAENAGETKLKLSESEIKKKEKDKKAEIEWARIRNIDKRSWDQEMRSIVALSHPVVIPKTKQHKVRRRITKSSITTTVSKDNHKLSKSTEDEGKLLEKALNKSLISPLNKNENYKIENSKEENSAVTIPCQSMIDLRLNSNQNVNLIDHVENDENDTRLHDQPLCKSSLNVINMCEESGDCVIVAYDNNLEVITTTNPENDHMSNKDYLLQVKHLRDSIKEKKQEKNESLNVSKEINSKSLINAKNTLEDYSTKDYNRHNESSAHSLKRSKELKHGHSYQTNENIPENKDMAGPCSLIIRQSIEIKPKEDHVEINPEPPVPSVKITPDMPREHDFNPLNAKCNLASLLETPFKCAILDLHMDTPKFISPGFFNDMGLSTFKLLDMPTPNFPTPRVTAKDCTPGSYSSRPTDYSGGSSYYKPDEIELNMDIAGPSHAKKMPVRPPTPVKEREDETDVSQRILRPRRTPKVYYPQAHPKVASKNISKSEPNETKTKIPAKIVVPVDVNVSSDSSYCSTCSSSDNDDSLLDAQKTIVTPPIVTKKNVNNSSLGSQTKRYTTSTPNSKQETNLRSTRRKPQNSKSATKVKEIFQKLKEKRLRANNKVVSSKNALQTSSSSNNDDLTIKANETSPIVTQETNKIPALDIETKKYSTFASNSKRERNAKSVKNTNNDSPSKLKDNLNRLALEEKRLRVISKLTASKFVPYKKDSKNTAPPKKIGQGSKKNTKPNLPKENKNPSTVEKISEITQQTSLVNKSPEASTSQIKHTNKFAGSTLKSRRKSSTPRKLAKVSPEPSNVSCLTEKQGTSKHTTVNHLAFEKHVEKQMAFINKENQINTEMNQNLSSFVEEGNVDKCCKNTDPQNSVQNKFGDDSTALEFINHPQHSLLPKLSDKLANEEDFVTLHLSSDEADLESSETKYNEIDSSDSSDLDKIRQYIANCSTDEVMKTPFQKNLEKEGFNALIAKKIERDLTDSNVNTSQVLTSESERPCDKPETINVCETATESNDKTQNSLELAKNLLKSPNKISSLSTSTHSIVKNTEKDNKFIMHKHDKNNILTGSKDSNYNNQNSLSAVEPPHTSPSSTHSTSLGSGKLDQLSSSIDKPLSSELSTKNASETSIKNKTHSKTRYRAKEPISRSKRKSPYKIKSPITEKNELKSPNKKSSRNISKVNPKACKRDKSDGIKKYHNHEKSGDASRKYDKHSKSKQNKNKDVKIKSGKKAEDDNCNVSEKVFSNEKTETDFNTDIVATDATVATDAVVWSRFELNISSPGFVKMVYQSSKKKCKQFIQEPFDISTFTLSATIVNSDTNAESVRSVTFTDFKELLELPPDHYLKDRLQRRERKKKVLQARNQKLDAQASVSKRPLDLLLDEMSDSSPSKSTQDTTDFEKDSPDNLNCMRNDFEIRTAVSSILMEEDPSRNAFFHTPCLVLSTDNVDSACETLTKAIIEDEFFEKLNEQESMSIAESKVENSPGSNEDDALMSFACVKSPSENFASKEATTVETKTVEHNEKRKRQDEEEEMDIKKPKLTPQHLLKEMDIESVLKKLHGPY